MSGSLFTSPAVAKAHAQPLGLLLLLALHVLDLLVLHLPVDLQLLVGQTHGGHAEARDQEEAVLG